MNAGIKGRKLPEKYVIKIKTGNSSRGSATTDAVLISEAK